MAHSSPKDPDNSDALRKRANQPVNGDNEVDENFDGDSVAKARVSATTEGRQVLALEMIADQLRLIAGRVGRRSAEVMHSDTPGVPENDQSESDPGKASPVPPGITRTWVEHFAVGNYNYTNLEDAIAEAQRAQKALPGAGAEPKVRRAPERA